MVSEYMVRMSTDLWITKLYRRILVQLFIRVFFFETLMIAQ